MEHLIIVEADIKNPAWVPDYLENVTPLVLKHGGSYLTRSQSVELLEGDSKPQFSLVAKFPDKESALRFYNSEEYKPYKSARQLGANSKFLLVAVENSAA